MAPALVASMVSLLAKDAYLQDLAKKICSQPGPERQRSKWGKASGPSSFWERSRSYEARVLGRGRTLHKGYEFERVGTVGARKGFSSEP